MLELMVWHQSYDGAEKVGRQKAPAMKNTHTKKKVLQLCLITLDRKKRGKHPPAKGESRLHK